MANALSQTVKVKLHGTIRNAEINDRYNQRLVCYEKQAEQNSCFCFASFLKLIQKLATQKSSAHPCCATSRCESYRGTLPLVMTIKPSLTQLIRSVY